MRSVVGGDKMESVAQLCQYSCPHCQGELEVISEPGSEQEVTCPHCGQPMVIESEPADTPELDVARIQKTARGRRAVIRVRSYYVTAAFACGILAADLIGRAAWQWMAENSLNRSLIDLAGAALFVWLGRRFQIKAKSIVDQAKRELAETLAPPDFSSLNDGSQVAENLKRMG
jgi:DNA-directed RNA polymerase subunit RPC12/RpoP